MQQQAYDCATLQAGEALPLPHVVPAQVGSAESALARKARLTRQAVISGFAGGLVIGGGLLLARVLAA